MAGSAPSAFIFLMTALIVSAAVSAILVESWEGIADTYSKNRDKAAIDAKTEFSFAGNAMKVDYDSTTDTMTFYLQNTGEIILDDSLLGAFVDGVIPGDSTTATVVGSGDWAPGKLLEIELIDTGWTYTDTAAEFEPIIHIVVQSELSNGVRGTDSLIMTVRLD